MIVLFIILSLLFANPQQEALPLVEPEPAEYTAPPTTHRHSAPTPTTPTTIGTPIMCDKDGVVYEWRDGGWEPTGDMAW